MRLPAWIAGYLSFALLGAGAGGSAARAQDDVFTKRVRPVLARHCFKCHGPDEKARKASFGSTCATRPSSPLDRARLRSSRVSPMKASWSDGSSPRTRGSECHPPRPRFRCLKSDKQVLKQWIADGAPNTTHWAFVPPRAVAAAASARCRLAAERDRCVHLRPARGRRAEAVAGGGSRDPDPAPFARPDRPAADARGGRRVRRETVA